MFYCDLIFCTLTFSSCPHKERAGWAWEWALLTPSPRSRTLDLRSLPSLMYFRRAVSLAETFRPMQPDWAGLGWGQGGLRGGIGELSQPGAVPSELTASRNHGCLSQTPTAQLGPVAQNTLFCCTTGDSACSAGLHALILFSSALLPPPLPTSGLLKKP